MTFNVLADSSSTHSSPENVAVRRGRRTPFCGRRRRPFHPPPRSLMDVTRAGESTLYHHFEVNYTAISTESGHRLVRR